MTALYRLLYRSHCAIDGGLDEVAAKVVALVETARAANAQRDVTGALLFSADVFVQALEGPLDAIEEIFERICADMRHRDLQLVDFTAADTRAFGEWSMASICPTGGLVSLFATVDTVERGRIDPANACAVVQLMRAMVVADSVQPRAGEMFDAGIQRLAEQARNLRSSGVVQPGQAREAR